MIRVSKIFYIGWSKCYSMFNPICLLFCPDMKVIAHCRFQIILYSYQIFITSSNSIYKLVSNTIICNIWVWRVQLIDEHPEESSATAPIWESCGCYTARIGNFEPWLSSSLISLIVLLAQHNTCTY